MADIKVSDLIKIIPDAFIPENAKNKEAIIQLIATGNDGGEWVIRIKDQICEVEKGKTEKPDFSLKADSEDILKIFFGELDPLRAYMRGKISFKGRIKQAMELTNLFQNDRDFYESRL
ncbi:MAG TPA: SCP2 sterol-binding domain-containing protein [Anaerolineaceae bacterium]|nr:SCP2 sterol-binding domain-containing protein [Anaerolineaceae bacterium]